MTSLLPPPSGVTVHPLVLLSVVDHYNRVAKDTKRRVVGCLLGSRSKGTIDVTNSFALPFEEDEKDPAVWYLDHNFMENMNSMFRKVASNERIVGWYSTGPKIRASDILINEMFRKYTNNPVYVIIDVNPKVDNSIPTEAYCGVYNVQDDGSASESTFIHVSSEIGALEAEEIGVEHLLRGVKDTTVSGLAHNVTAKLHSLAGLRQRLVEMQTYLDNVCQGKMPINHDIVYSIQEIFNLLPSTQLTQMSQSFVLETNDMMLVVYLASLVRATVALHDLINNKKANKEAERLADEKDNKAAEEKALADEAATEEKGDEKKTDDKPDTTKQS